MRITCPCCGERDIREFTYLGHETFLHRPTPDAGGQAWDDYLHNRENPAGPVRDLWYHDPCGSWVLVIRDTRTHAVAGSEPVGGAA